jgi:hypothetical protein
MLDIFFAYKHGIATYDAAMKKVALHKLPMAAGTKSTTPFPPSQLFNNTTFICLG